MILAKKDGQYAYRMIGIIKTYANSTGMSGAEYGYESEINLGYGEQKLKYRIGYYAYDHRRGVVESHDPLRKDAENVPFP